MKPTDYVPYPQLMRRMGAYSLLVLTLLTARVADAQHPVDVQRLAAEGDYFKALAVYELLPSRQLDQDTYVSAAKSAWALGLTKQASALFDTVLRKQGLSDDDRARLTLSRAAIEHQEERYQEAALFAEKAAGYIVEKAPLRGRALLLLGQSLLRLGAYASAEEKLLEAFADAAPSDRPDVAFSLGTVQLKLGKLAEAERAFKAIPTDHLRAASAVRLLAVISLQSEQGDRARFWIERGKSNYSEGFLDSWGDYGLATVALKADNIAEARAVVEKAEKRYPPSDGWLILMQAALEQAEWNHGMQGQKP
jgi:tetratricopeptide (TPR) repeat protein